MIHQVRSELRKTASVSLWWALLIPAALLAVLIGLFGGLVTSLLPEQLGDVSVVIGSVALGLSFTVVFATLHAVVATTGEFRHRTITTTYLTATGRGRVLAAKAVVHAAVGVVYVLVSAVLGVLAGLLGQGSAALPAVGPLIATVAIAAAVVVLWSALGTALGTLMSNQVGAVVVLLGYVLLGELLLSGALLTAESPSVGRISSYLPVNAADIALYDVPAQQLAGPRFAQEVVEVMAGVSDPPPWWGAVPVLAAWTLALGAAAWVVGRRRDIT